MKNAWKKPWFCALVLAMAVSFTVALAAQLLLRNLWAFLESEPQMQAIFAQISDANMTSPIWLLLILSFAYLFFVLHVCKRRLSRVLAGLLGVLVLLILLCICLLLTRVNGIRFCDILVSLFNAAQKGWLDGL